MIKFCLESWQILQYDEININFHEDPDADNWNYYKMNGVETKIYYDELFFKNSGEVATLNGFSPGNDYKFYI